MPPGGASNATKHPTGPRTVRHSELPGPKVHSATLTSPDPKELNSFFWERQYAALTYQQLEDVVAFPGSRTAVTALI